MSEECAGERESNRVAFLEFDMHPRKCMRRTLPDTWLYIIIGILITNHFPRSFFHRISAEKGAASDDELRYRISGFFRFLFAASSLSTRPIGYSLSIISILCSVKILIIYMLNKYLNGFTR